MIGTQVSHRGTSRAARWLLLALLGSQLHLLVEAKFLSCFGCGGRRPDRDQDKVIVRHLDLHETFDVIDWQLTSRPEPVDSPAANMQQIRDWLAAERNEPANSPKRISGVAGPARSSVRTTMELLYELGEVDGDEFKCNMLAYHTLNRCELGANLRLRLANTIRQPLRPIDQLVRFYANRQSRKCLAQHVGEYADLPVQPWVVEEMADLLTRIYIKQMGKTALRYQKLYGIREEDLQESETVRLIENAASIVYPSSELDVRLGDAIREYLSRVAILHRYARSLRQLAPEGMYNSEDIYVLLDHFIMNPCRHFIDKTQTLMELVGRDIRSLNQSVRVYVEQADASQQELLKGYTIHQHCRSIVNNQHALFNNLALSVSLAAN